MENGMNTKYNPLEMGGGMWWADSFDALRVWLLQRAPFNLTDGVWLRQALPTGPIDAAQAELFSVYSEITTPALTSAHVALKLHPTHFPAGISRPATP